MRLSLICALLIASCCLAPAGELANGIDPAAAGRRTFVVTARPTREVLPARVVNTTYLPVVTSQGPLGTCGAYGATYYYRTFLKARENGWLAPDPDVNPERCASTAYTYKLMRTDPQAGANILGTMLRMTDFGVCSLAQLPYTYDMDTYSWPEEIHWKQAIPWRAAAAGQIPAINTLAGQAVLKAHLYGGGRGDMAVIALRNAENLVDYPAGMHTSNNVLYALQEAKTGVQHALTVIGYDDDMEYLDERDGLTKKGAFLVVNSWGQGWGVTEPGVGTGGFAWIAYDLFLKDLQDDRNGSSMAAVMLERGEYTPRSMLRVAVRIGLNDSGMRLLSGGISASGEGGESVSLFPGTGNEAHPVDQGIWIDTTDMLASGSAGLNLWAWQFEGTLSYLDEVKLSSWDETRQLSWTEAGPLNLSSDFLSPTHLYIGRYQNELTVPSLATIEGDAGAVDWDGDGDLDLAVTCSTGTQLWTNAGGTNGFSSVVRRDIQAGHTIRWLDADGDGIDDLLVGGDSATRIYAGDGSGGFSEYASLPGCRRKAVAIADFDRDGRADIVLGGILGTTFQLNGPGGFEELDLGLPTLSTLGGGNGIVVAHDLTGDGLPDLVFAGTGTVSNSMAGTLLFRNVGVPFRFEELSTELPQVYAPAVAIADWDADGDPDLAISGCSDGNWVRLYQNDGTGDFTERETELPTLREGALQWCDLNADGRPDLVGTGATSELYGDISQRAPDTVAVLNRGDGTFIDYGLPVPNVYRGFFDARDLTGDGNPDLLVAGTSTWTGESNPANLVCGLYDYSVSLPGLFPINEAPEPPTGLVCTHEGAGVLSFTWSAGSDDTTPTAGLRYELRCGTSAGAGDLIHGEIGQSGLQLREPPVGTLHWQVRTIDAAHVVSAWTAAQEFTVPAYQAQYQLELDVSPAGSGTLTADPAGPLLTAGTVVTLTATPATGFEFSAWAGDTTGLSRATQATVTIGEHRWIQAQFTQIPNPVHPVWSLVTNEIMSPVGYWGTTGHTVESYNGKLVRIMGEGYWTPTPQEWITASSDNGNTWQNVWLEGDIPPARYNHASTVYDGKLWIAGGLDRYDDGLTDVWYTTDLAHWTQATASAPWQGRDRGDLVAANGKLWFLGGGYWGTRFADVWYSTDGATWTAVATPAPWSQSYMPGGETIPWAVSGTPVRATVLNDVIYTTDGASVWISANGVDWTLLATEPDPFLPLPEGASASPFAPLWKFGFVAFDNQIHILGGENWRLGETKDEVWSSANGSDWSRSAPVTRAHWAPQENPAACVHNGELFLVSGESASSAPIGDVWSCIPGEMPAGMGSLELEATPLTPWVGGTTEPPPGSYVDTLGSTFHLRAVPSYGYVLDHWEGSVTDDGDGDPATMDVTLAATETRIRAVFTFATTRLTVRVEPYGTGHTTPEEQTAYAYPPNEYVDVSAVAKPGYVFSHWTGPVEDANSDHTRVFMDAPHEVVAVFLEMPVRDRMSCATDWAAVVRSDGTVWGVGNNNSSQMGHSLDIDNPDEFWPVSLTSGVSQVYVEDDGAKAVMSDGTMLAWGPRYSHYLVGVRPHAYMSLTGVVQCTGDTNLSAAYRKSDGALCDYLGSPLAKTFGDGEMDDIIDISGRNDSHFAVETGGKLFAWGDNLAGQLGIDGLRSVGSPREVPGVDRVYCTVSGFDALHPFVLALRDNGTVWSWGDPRNGQLGRTIAREVPAEAPAAIPGLSNVKKVAAGANHGLALTRDGQLYAWGGNHFGQLGTGNFDNADTPVLVTTPGEVVDVAAGPFYTLLHLADDTYCWMGATPGGADEPLTTPTAIPGLGGTNTQGVLTTATDPTDADGSMYPPPGTHAVVLNRPVSFEASNGERHVFSHWSTLETSPTMQLSLTADATVTARFRFAYDALARLDITVDGNGTVDPTPGQHEYAPGTVLTITALPEPGHAFSHWEGNVADTSANRTTVLMDRDQTVRACFEPIPQQVPPRIATGLTSYYDGLFLHTDASVYACRAGSDTEFVRIDADNTPMTGVLRLAVGKGGLCMGLCLDSTIYSWGGDPVATGQNLTADDYVSFAGKVVDSTGTLTNAIDISAGDDFGLALLADGTLRTWGANDVGQLGHSTGEPSVSVARTVVAEDGKPLTELVAASCGSDFVVAVNGSGDVFAWGGNAQGQLGNQSVASSAVPVAVAGLPSIVDVDAGQDFAAAIDSAGQVWTWGRSDVGQCGRGTRAAIEAPGIVSGLPAIAELALGEEHALALARDGSVWAWGSGETGRLGNGDTADCPTPVQVHNSDGSGYLTNVVALDCAVYSYAITANGTLYSWGFSDWGSAASRPRTLAIDVGASEPGTSSLHALSLECFPPEGGTLSPGAGTIFLSHGTFVTVCAVPKSGYRFLYWKGTEATTTERVLGIRLTQDTRITAHFAPREPRLRLGNVETLAGTSVFVHLYMEGQSGPLEGVSTTVSLPPGLSFTNSVRGSRLPSTFLARASFPSFQSAVTLVSGDGSSPALTPNAEEPIYSFEVKIPAECPIGDYPVQLSASSAAAIAAGRGWVTPKLVAGTIAVLPSEGIDLRFVMQSIPGPDSELETTPHSGIDSVRVGRGYVAELWLRDKRQEGSPTAQVALDMGFDTVGTCDGFAEVGQIVAPAGSIAADSVTGYGGTLTGARVPGLWYRLGAIEFTATTTGENVLTALADNVTITLADASVFPTASIDFDVSEAHVEHVANQVPVATLGTPTVGAWGTQLVGQLSGADANADDVLTFAIADGPDHGTIELDAATGQFVYTPDPSHAGSDSFNFTVSDGTETSPPITQQLYVTTGWCVTLMLGDAWTMLGREPSGSDQSDDAGDLLASPIDPMAFVPAQGNRAGELQRDIRSATGNVAWRLQIAAQGSAAALTWDPATMPAGLRIMRIAPVESPLGTERSVELSATDNIPLAAGTAYTFDIAMPTDLALGMETGWNLVCLPGQPIFPDSTLGQADTPTSYGIWQWDNQAYLSVAEAEPYMGYWFYCANHGLRFFTILPAFARDLPLEAGWNVIGVPRTSRVEDLLGPGAVIWRFRGQRYEQPDILDPGEGYWYWSTEAGILDLTEDAR